MHPATDFKSYDPLRAQEFLDSCNRDLEELRSRVLRTSVRCHMLEVDLATQFSPHIHQLLTNAQDTCQQCTQTLESLNKTSGVVASKNAASGGGSGGGDDDGVITSTTNAPFVDDQLSVSGEENTLMVAEN